MHRKNLISPDVLDSIQMQPSIMSKINMINNIYYLIALFHNNLHM